MNNYDDFISELGEVVQIPKNAYTKVRFRVAAQKFVVPASLAVLILCVFAGTLLFENKNVYNQHDFDITANADIFLFAQGSNFYSLFDDR